MAGVEDVGVFILEKGLALKFSSQTLFQYKYPNILNTNHCSHLPVYEDGTGRVFRNVGIQTSEAGELPRRKHTTTT
jgi:hypothetical protein